MSLPALFAGQPEPPDGDRGLYFTHGINIASLAGKSTTFYSSRHTSWVIDISPFPMLRQIWSRIWVAA